MADHRSAQPEPRRAIVAPAALGLVIVVMAVIVFRTLTGPTAKDALSDFVAALNAGDLQAAAALAAGDAGAAVETLEENFAGLDGAEVEATAQAVSEDGDAATATVTMAWTVPEFGAFEYSNDRIRLELSDGEWKLDFSERVVHPQLEPGERLGTVETPAERAPILDRSGDELVAVRPVVEVGVVPRDLDDPEGAAEAIAALTGADAEVLAEAIDAAEPDAFVPAITLRAEEFEPVEAELRAFEGVELGTLELPLAPTRDFARAVLGTVGPVTAEQLEESEGELETGDQIGQSGLQAAFDEQLAGTPERSVVIRNAEDEAVDTLQTAEGEPGEALETTLDLETQAAAEEALSDLDSAAGLVALEPGSGDILAVANRPTDDGFNRAMAGQYPPGSTFKVVSTAALLADGLDTSETVDCPATIEAGGRDFRNFEGSAAGAVPFSTDFAQSCNTAFVSLADRLGDDELTEAGDLFGLGRDLGDLPLDAFGGEIPRSRDETEQAAAMIGQARILASPLAMAGVAATVVDGRWHQPRLVESDPAVEGSPLPRRDAESLRTLMRSVVTTGTGTALAAIPGEPIGKSGTAEYGSGDPPPTHAWFIAGREDVAVAVIVEDGASGGEVAAPIVAAFLTALDLDG